MHHVLLFIKLKARLYNFRNFLLFIGAVCVQSVKISLPNLEYNVFLIKASNEAKLLMIFKLIQIIFILEL